jgi:hypothetical protein
MGGEKYMTSNDFIRRYLQLLPSDNYHLGSLKLLGGIIDTSKDGLISFPEFQAFEGRLCVPDALYSTAFRLFDTSGNGYVSFDEFKEIITQTTFQQKIPFDLNGKFVKLYFGRNKKRLVSYEEFSQFLYVRSNNRYKYIPILQPTTLLMLIYVTRISIKKWSARPFEDLTRSRLALSLPTILSLL